MAPRGPETGIGLKHRLPFMYAPLLTPHPDPCPPHYYTTRLPYSPPTIAFRLVKPFLLLLMVKVSATRRGSDE